LLYFYYLLSNHMEAVQVKSVNEQMDIKESLTISNTTEKDNNPTLVLLNTMAKDVQKDIEWSWSLSSRKSERWNLQVKQIWEWQFIFESYNCQTKFDFDGKNISINGLLKWPASDITKAFRVMNLLNSAIHEHRENKNGVNLDYTDSKKFILEGDSIVSWFNVPGAADSSEAKQKYFDLPLIRQWLPHTDDKKAQKEDMKFIVDYLNNH
jgi:hypothetical protein